MFSVQYLLRRLSRQRLLSTGVLLGIALAVALGTAIPLATNALAVLGLRATVAALPPITRNIQLVRQGEPLDPALQEHIRQQLGTLLAGDYLTSYLPVVSMRRAQPPVTRPVRLRRQADLEA